MRFSPRKWVPATSGPGGPTADAQIDHPGPAGMFVDVETIPLWIAPDPGGVAPRAASEDFVVAAPDTPIQHSPVTNWNPGSPYPGPPARVTKYIDYDSIKFWGRTGQGQLIWSEQTEFSADLPPNLPQDIVQHVDVWQRYMGGYPNIARNRPTAFADQLPTFNPATLVLPEG